MKRRLALSAVVVVAFGWLSTVEVATAPPAEAHGNCWASAWTPDRQASQVWFQGAMDCGEYHCDVLAVTIYAYRRSGTPNGTWNLINSKFIPTNPYCSEVNFGGLYLTYNCDKDYKSQVIGRAEPGSHASIANSGIMFHSC
jgi:hypothetical protein